ncbi:MAG: DUF4157 domain-containing protein [Solirubrobacteraceae bacterium]
MRIHHPGKAPPGTDQLRRTADRTATRLHAAVRRSAVDHDLVSPGQPLAGPLTEEVENLLGADFSHVPVHAGSAARAFTPGSHVPPGRPLASAVRTGMETRLGADFSHVPAHTDAAPPVVHEALRGPGAPLDASTRNLMEERLGTDFSHVRVHTGERAAASARAVDALAYTVGSSIVFGSGRYAPHTDQGQRLLAHELVHTIQQGRGGPPLSGQRLSVGSPASPAEHEARMIDATVAPLGLSGAPLLVQRNNGATSPRPASAVSSLAGQLASGERDVHDEALGLSEQQQQMIGVLLVQLRALEEIQRELDEVRIGRERLFELAVPTIRLDSFVAFEPEFAHPAGNDVANVLAQHLAAGLHRPASRLAADALVNKLGTGLKPASELGADVVRSGDEHVAKVVSVNVFPPTGEGDTSPAKREQSAEYGAYNPAGGAGPIAIERSEHAAAGQEALEKRAAGSAVLIIDPARLSGQQQKQVEASRTGGGGELGLSGVPAEAIVAVLAPVAISLHLTEEQIGKHRIQFVGSTKGPVHYAAGQRKVTIAHPDFKSGLAAVFAANPNKTLLTHTTRLGLVRAPLSMVMQRDANAIERTDERGPPAPHNPVSGGARGLAGRRRSYFQGPAGKIIHWRPPVSSLSIIERIAT